MNGGRITNFTLEGDAIKLTAFLDEGEKTRYTLDLSFIEGEMSYEHLLETITDLKRDIDEVLRLRETYKRDPDGNYKYDDNGHLVPNGEELDNDMIQTFESMWSHAHE